MEDQRLSIFITIGVSILISSTLVSTHPLARATNDYGGYPAESYPEDHPTDPSYYQNRNEQPSGASASYSASYSSLTQQPLNSAYSLTSYLNPLSYFGSGSGSTGGGGANGGGSGSHDPSYGSGGSGTHDPAYGAGSGTHDPSYGGSSPYGAGSHDQSYTPNGSPGGYGSDPHQPSNPHDPGHNPTSGMLDMVYGSAKSSVTDVTKYAGSSSLNVDLKYGSSGMDPKYGPPPPPPGMDSKYGPPPPPGMDSKYGPPPPPPGMNSKYGPPPPPGMDSKYGPPPPPPGMGSKYGPPPPPPGMDSKYGPPPPPGMDSKYGPPPPPPGMDPKYGPPHGPLPPNMDPKYGQKSTDYGTTSGHTGGSDPSGSPGTNRAYDLASGAKYPEYSTDSGSTGSTGGAQYAEY